VNRKPYAQLIRQYRKAFHDPAISGQVNLFGNDRHGFFVPVRKNFAKPADAARQR
jgi:hypothetical protein